MKGLVSIIDIRPQLRQKGQEQAGLEFDEIHRKTREKQK